MGGFPCQPQNAAESATMATGEKLQVLHSQSGKTKTEQRLEWEVAGFKTFQHIDEIDVLWDNQKER